MVHQSCAKMLMGNTDITHKTLEGVKNINLIHGNEHLLSLLCDNMSILTISVFEQK